MPGSATGDSAVQPAQRGCAPVSLFEFPVRFAYICIANHNANPMTPDKARYFYEQLHAVDRSGDSFGVGEILRIYATLSELSVDVTADEPQIFADLYSRLMFVFDKYSLPDYVQSQVQALRLLANTCRKKPSMTVGPDKLAGCLRAVSLLVFHFSNESAPAALREFYTAFPPLHYEARKIRKKETLSHIQVTVLAIEPGELYGGRHRRCVVTCEADELGTIKVALWNAWSELEHLLWPYAVVNLFDIQKLSDEQNLYSTTKDSLVVLEPDFLIDATDIAECFQHAGPNPNLYVLKKFIYADPTEPMLLGNIANFCFDELIADINCNFDDVFARALRQKPLQVVALLKKNAHLLPILRDKARAHFDTVREVLSRLRYDAAVTEPTFISALYGLQGRLDLMIEYDADEYRKDVVELKSGSPASSHPGLWRNHLAQVTCYNLLLDSCYEHRSGSSSVLYLRAGDKTLRNAPNIIQLKQDVLALRNRLVAAERELSNRKFQALKKLAPQSFGPAPSFTAEHIRTFAGALAAADTLERKYFYLFTSFVAREHWTGKTGGTREDDPGFAGLWRTGITEKEERYKTLGWLALDTESSDFTQLYLAFTRTDRTVRVSTLRTGDIILLYPLEESGEARPLNHQILKGTIREMTPDRVVVSLRNKQQRTEDFARYAFWVIEHDFLATGFKSMHESLFDFLRAPAERRRLLLGRCRPESTAIDPVHYNDLTDEQNELLNKALSARQYFLLQGPPGTGKTSRMLRSMVRRLHEHTDEHIVVLAFTNRAVDEICDAIKSIEPQVPFIRLGTKNSTDHTDAVLTEILGDGPIENLATVIDKTRVIVATVASLLKNREVLSVKHFSTAIVDEASQIVEPQIVGLLAQFDRFILIGDEKQLPAVVTQQACGLSIADPDLNAVGVADLRTSLFERLLTLCKRNGWDNACGMISRQGRMHRDIQDFPNRMFYDNRLTWLRPWQDDPAHVLDVGASEEPLARALTRSRILFFPSGRERTSKVHREEARRTALLLDTIRRHSNGGFSQNTVGVITPYRAQIATIMSSLPAHLHGLVTVDTVERYQGSERDIIILSFAASHASQLRNLQSLSADGQVDRKLNVALTRARHQLILLGCPDVLNREPLFRSLLEYIRDRGGYIEDDLFPAAEDV